MKMREVWARVRATRGSPTHDGTDAIHGCCALLFLFSWLDTKRLSGRAAITSLVSMHSVCAVSRSVIRCVLRVLRSPEHTITTNVLCVSDSASNVLSTNPKRNLASNSVRSQQTFVAKVTVCRHVVSKQTFVSGLDHCRVLIIHRPWDHVHTKHAQPAKERKKKARDIDLQWCLVEDTACPQPSFVSSVQVMRTCLTDRQSPDLIIASRRGLRASLWAAAWATTTLLHIVVRKVTGQTAFDFVVSSSSLVFCIVEYSQDLITATFVGSFSNLFSLPTALLVSDILGIMSTNSSSFHCMQHIPVRLPMASISANSTFRSPSMTDLPVEHTPFDRITISLQD